MRLTRLATLGGLLSMSPLLAAAPAMAQSRDWPNRRLRLLVPSAAGGYEVYARILAPRLAELLGQPVVVDNKPGANGIIGMQEVQRSPADGYTFMFAHVGAISIGSSIYSNMPLDPVDDLASISVAVTSPLVWVVTPSLPFKSMPEFIAKAKAEPGQWRYGLPASGSIPHLVAEDTKIRHKIDMPAVPYRSTPQSLMAVISGEVPVTLDSLGASSGHIAGGKLRALAVTSTRRVPSLPEVPTLAEAGVPGYEYIGWTGVAAPAATPAALVERLNREINRIATSDEGRRWFQATGADAGEQSPAEFAAFVQAEHAKLGALVRAAGLRAE